MEVDLKAFLLFLALVSCALINLFFSAFTYLPLWYSFAAHFFIAGMLFSYFVVEFWIWFDRESFYRSKSFLCFSGILSGNSLGGILWEIFEYWYSQGAISIGNADWFYRDTIWDFQMNFSGSVIIAALICYKKSTT